MPVEEYLLRLVEIDAVEALPAGREAHHEHPRLDQHTVQKKLYLTEINLCFLAQRVVLNESLQKLVRANVNDLLTSYDVALIVAIAIHDNCAKYSDKMQSYIDTAHITG